MNDSCTGIVSPKRRRAMIVEDEGVTAILVKRVLTKYGYEIVGTAMNGETAVEMARATLPDFILTDIRIPGMNGLEAAKQILAERPIPIIVLTAFADEEHRLEALTIGVCGYVVKPTSVDMLAKALEEAFCGFDTLQAEHRID